MTNAHPHSNSPTRHQCLLLGQAIHHVGCGGTSDLTMTMIYEAYKFSAPRFFGFSKGEFKEEMRKAEIWFESTLSYAPSRIGNAHSNMDSKMGTDRVADMYWHLTKTVKIEEDEKNYKMLLE